MSDKIEVIIYSKPGCCLCDEAKAIMLAADCRDEFALVEINIETDPELYQRYRYEIPVIFVNGRKAFKFHITAAQFCARLRRVKQGVVETDEESA